MQSLSHVNGLRSTAPTGQLRNYRVHPLKPGCQFPFYTPPQHSSPFDSARDFFYRSYCSKRALYCELDAR